MLLSYDSYLSKVAYILLHILLKYFITPARCKLDNKYLSLAIRTRGVVTAYNWAMRFVMHHIFTELAGVGISRFECTGSSTSCYRRQYICYSTVSNLFSSKYFLRILTE